MKVQNFQNAKNRLAYAYILTPAGIKSQKGANYYILRRKQAEYEALQRDIKALEEGLAGVTLWVAVTRLTTGCNPARMIMGPHQC